MFKCFLGLGSFDSPKGPLAHKQFFFPITFGGIEFISTTTIALTTILGSSTFRTSIVVVRIMVDQRPFLFETLA
jgi:hypothetical protein